MHTPTLHGLCCNMRKERLGAAVAAVAAVAAPLFWLAWSQESCLIPADQHAPRRPPPRPWPEPHPPACQQPRQVGPCRRRRTLNPMFSSSWPEVGDKDLELAPPSWSCEQGIAERRRRAAGRAPRCKSARVVALRFFARLLFVSTLLPLFPVFMFYWFFGVFVGAVHVHQDSWLRRVMCGCRQTLERGKRNGSENFCYQVLPITGVQ